MLPESISHYFNGFVGINTGIMLTGKSGTGKSGVFNLVTMWALKNGWIVLPVFKASYFTHTPALATRHNVTGLYIQNEPAKKWLEEFKQINNDLLESFLIDEKIYGKYGFSGLH